MARQGKALIVVSKVGFQRTLLAWRVRMHVLAKPCVLEHDAQHGLESEDSFLQQAQLLQPRRVHEGSETRRRGEREHKHEELLQRIALAIVEGEVEYVTAEQIAMQQRGGGRLLFMDSGQCLVGLEQLREVLVLPLAGKNGCKRPTVVGDPKDMGGCGE